MSHLQINKSKVNLQLLSGVCLGASVLVGGVYFLNPFAVDNSYAANTDVSVSYTASDWTISAPTSTAADAGGITIDLDPTSDGTNAARKDTVTSGSTNVPNYQIYVSVDSEGGKIPATSGDSAIAATSGTSAAPAALGSNSWGYALASFDDTTNYDDLVSNSKSDSWSNSKWAKLPYVATDNLEDGSKVSTDAAKIYDSTTNTGNSVDVYYAVNADNDLASGEYQTTVTYTLIGEMPTPPAEYMHELDASWCSEKTAITSSNSSSIQDYTYEVTDARTGEAYWVRKFGNLCWMVENLYLPAGTTISTTNNYSKVNFSTYPTTSTDPTASWPNAANGAKITNGSRYRTSNSGNYDGTYMNWYTATAGTGGDRGTSKAATSDICPTNWRLPTHTENGGMSVSSIGGSINNFYATSTGATTSPIRPGYYNSSGLDNAGTYAFWWSSTQYSDTYAYRLTSDSGSLTTTYPSKYLGYSVRCVLPAE